MTLLEFLFVGAALASQSSQAEAKIVVQGFGEVRTPPRLATITYELRGEGIASDDAAKVLVTKAQAVESALRGIDPVIVPRATSTGIIEVRGPECRPTQNYNEPRLSVGPCAVTGYVATQRMSFDTGRVSDAGTMVGVAARAGARDPVVNSLSVGDDKAIRRAAIAAALADARAKAQAIAESGGVRLGSITSVALDGARFREDLVSAIPPPPPPPPPPQPAPVVIEFAPKPIVTTAQVTVTFAIER